MMFFVLAAVTAAPEKARTYAAIGVVAEVDDGLWRAVGSVTKVSGLPLLNQTEVWEPRIDNGYPNVVVQEGTWQLFYGDCVGVDADCSIQIVCYAESDDGFAWTKPNLGVYDLDAVRPDLEVGTSNNIILQGGGVGVSRSHQDHHHRHHQYVAFGDFCCAGGNLSGTTYSRQNNLSLPECSGGSVHANVATSDDGIEWGSCFELDWPKPQRYDCHNNVFFHDGAWLATTRNYDDDQRMIAIDISADDDLSSFDTDKAPKTTMAGTEATQLYSQITFYWHGVFLGLVMAYDADDPKTFGNGKVHCRLAFSSSSSPVDGWDWVQGNDTDFIPLGHQGADVRAPDNAFDSHVIFAAKPITYQHQERIYYFGGNGPHSGDRNSSLGLATLRRDGFAAIRGTGILKTIDLLVSAPILRLTVDVFAHDDACVWVRTVNATRLDGTAAVCDNVTDAVVTGLDLSPYVGRTVPLEFELRDAALYTLGFVDPRLAISPE